MERNAEQAWVKSSLMFAKVPAGSHGRHVHQGLEFRETGLDDNRVHESRGNSLRDLLNIICKMLRVTLSLKDTSTVTVTWFYSLFIKMSISIFL